MLINSEVLGEIEIETKDIIHFAKGIPAFEEYQQYVIIPLEERSPFYYLQSVQKTDLCLVIAQPFVFFPDYEIEIADDELQSLEVNGEAADLAIYVILTIPDDFRLTTANLLAPIVVNPENHQAMQYVTVGNKYSSRHLIFRSESMAAAAKEGD
ncbi:MAG: flagellar assembly protein FliW [Syntrophomonadaceae bacterium]|nr:flagellar assembly protein FliW [Syntrophomonadaceae bacterium]